jgi:SAM-dependent methyltransferase
MDRKAYFNLSKYEDNHWWFTARRIIIDKVLKAHFPDRENAEILEVGCGSGGNLELLSNFGKVHAMDLDEYCIEIANKRNICHVKHGSLPDDLPFDERFELICMFDVLEHIEDDQKALKTVSESLGDEGVLLITVPAYSFLWSSHDVALNHKRRYVKKRLLDILASAGFRAVYSTYFNSFLMPVVLLVRVFNNFVRKSRGDDLKTSSEFVNKLLSRVFSGEKYFIPRFSLPFGVSILIVAKKNNEK